ncbi:MAG: tetratricopeptide repeat protein [Thermodesulfobacteriota bacterium]|nr:tetratricopeptide repeat protein [Thermodesulfobacteriota bacterium]
MAWKDDRVIKVVTDWFIPLRVMKEKHENLFKKHLIVWTPTILILDTEGRDHCRFSGFLTAVELCARIILDGAKAELNLGNYELALKCFEEVVEKYRETFAVPEAIFYLAVARFLPGHNPKVLKEGLERLRKEFPESEWTLRAKPYELIK